MKSSATNWRMPNIIPEMQPIVVAVGAGRGRGIVLCLGVQVCAEVPVLLLSFPPLCMWGWVAAHREYRRKNRKTKQCVRERESGRRCKRVCALGGEGGRRGRGKGAEERTWTERENKRCATTETIRKKKKRGHHNVQIPNAKKRRDARLIACVRVCVYLFGLPDFFFGVVAVRGRVWRRTEQASNACVCERITLGV